MKKLTRLFALTFLLLSACSPHQKKQLPTDVKFQKETIKRLGGNGDNWCITWAKDNSQITSMCDGNWLNIETPNDGFHTHLFRIKGDAANFTREDIPNYPDFSGNDGSWFGYGIIAIDNTIYTTISKTPGESWSGPFRGIKLLKSTDNGKTWNRIDQNRNELFIDVNDSIRNIVNEKEMFFLEEYGVPHRQQTAYPFSFVSFVQDGQNNSANKDGYIYIYSPEGAHANQLTLARVKKEKLGIRNEWQYFTNFDSEKKPHWTSDIKQRGYVAEYPQKSLKGDYFGWYSWLPSVVWNKGLGLYIMVNGGTYAGHGMTNSDKDYYDKWMHTESGSLGFWYSEKPYGPWTQFYYTDYWIVDDTKNRTYQPKLSPKWISDDGKQMTLIWSDAMKNEKGQSHAVHYYWNQMKVLIEL